MTRMRICRESGFKAGENCPDTENIFAGYGALDAGPCPYHRKLHMDKNMTWQVNSGCYPVQDMKHVSWFILPPAQAYYYKKNNSNYADPPEFMDRCIQDERDMIEMIYPRMYTKVYIPIEIDGDPGRVVFHATHRNPGRNIYWHLDEDYIGTTRNNHQLGLRPVKGEHTLNLIDDQGSELLVKFEVLSD